MKKKVIYILHDIQKALAFEWIISSIDRDKIELHFILNGVKPGTYMEQYCRSHDIPVYRLEYASKKDLPRCVFTCYKLFKKIKPDAVHCHLFEACIIGLTAAKLAGVKKRIHTRHHSMFHHEYFPKAVKYDRYINALSTHVVAISKLVKEVLVSKENVPESKVVLIHHGFDLSLFLNPDEKIISELRLKYNPQNKKPVIGIISRYLKLKGIEFCIEAFKKLLQRHPDALLILANARGSYKNVIEQHLQSLPPSSFIEITFENKIEALYRLFDVYLHVPINASTEAFGQTYIEALVSEVPSVFTISGVANEFIKDRENALVVPYQNAEAIYDSIIELLENESFRKKITLQGKEDVSESFSLHLMIDKLTKLYLE